MCEEGMGFVWLRMWVSGELLEALMYLWVLSNVGNVLGACVTVSF
jgi:hypothetical protein